LHLLNNPYTATTTLNAEKAVTVDPTCNPSADHRPGLNRLPWRGSGGIANQEHNRCRHVIIEIAA
jgi:hypothetical protein